ncbi:hypothetical protein GmHk_02G005389 [Glycine max]|nr:hypothetical protein GmHk_02G005389 [Glycine max]
MEKNERRMASEELIIRDNVSDLNDDEQQRDFHEHGEPSNQKNQEYSNPYQRRGSASANDLYEGLTFESKQAVVNVIKQFQFMHSFNFDVIENKSDKYIVMCNQYGNECYWRARVSFSKIRKRWELKKLNGIHTYTNSFISQDHVRLDSSVITHNIVHLVKTNPGIKIKTLIVDMHQRFGYTISYKKAWTTKQKALEMTFGSWEQSYSYLPVWLTAAKHFVPWYHNKIQIFILMEEGDDGPPRVILNRVFWAFNPCIEGFQYCKPLVQVDETFLTGKYHGILLTAIEQDGSKNNFPLAFAIVESEIGEAWM